MSSQAPQLTDRAWTIRSYQSGDESMLVGLFARVFNRPISEAHWRWKLQSSSLPVENVWLAVADGRPIFQYAGIPVRCQLLGQERLGIISVDTMTAPEYRRQGLLTTVGNYTYERWRKSGVAFVFGLPNEKWGSRAEALGWKTLFPLKWLLRPLRPERLLARRLGWAPLGRLAAPGRLWNAIWNRRIQGDGTVSVRTVERAEQAFDTLWRRCAADYPNAIVRDSEWVNWRYIEPPTTDYRLLLAERMGEPVGFLAYRLHEVGDHQIAFIADLFAGRHDQPARGVLLHTAIEQLETTEAELIATLAIPDTFLHRTFHRAGFRLSWSAFTVQLLPLDPALPWSDLRRTERWHLAGGDFDVV